LNDIAQNISMLNFIHSAKAIGLLNVLLLGQMLIAAPVPPTIAQSLNCTNPQTQSEMNACEGQRWKTADRALNRTYQTLLPKLSSSRRQQLRTAQLNWISFRDRECEFAGSAFEGGSMQPLIVAGCQANLTNQRTAELNAYLTGKGLPARSKNYTQSDRKLNQQYQNLKRELDDARKRQLERAEQAWINYRDTACAFEASGGGNAARTNCLIRLTEQRTQRLQEYESFR
jgi:uncharacterized protein YecT (DUF1311 family)